MVADTQMRSITKQLGRRLRQLRVAQRLSPGVAAAQLGVGVSTLYHWESGLTPPTFPNLLAAAKLYQVDEAALFFFLGNPRHNLFELLRVASPHDLDALQPLIEKRVGKTVDAILVEHAEAQKRRRSSNKRVVARPVSPRKRRKGEPESERQSRVKQLGSRR